MSGSPASAVATEVDLGAAATYSVLAGSTVTNAGTSTVAGDLGVSPGTAVDDQGALLVGGVTHLGDAEARLAKDALTAAYGVAAGQLRDVDADDELGGETLVGGVYNRAAAMALNGQLILDGANNPDSVWVFQAGTTLITGSASSVLLINGADPCNVFWQVGSSATLGTTTAFVGTIMADQSVSLQTGATLQGRALARIAAVTLDSNVITTPVCAAPVETPDETPDETPVETPDETPVETPGETPGDNESAGGTPTAPGRSGDGPTTRTDITTDVADNPTPPTVPGGHPNTGMGGTALSAGIPTGLPTGPTSGPWMVLWTLGSLLAAGAVVRSVRSTRATVPAAVRR